MPNKDTSCIFVGLIKELSGHEYGKRVYSKNGVSPTVVCGGGGYQDLKILEGDCVKYRIRKLSPRECARLQGVKDEDFEKIAKKQSDGGLYHLFGDSITTTVLMGIFGELADVPYWDKIEEVEKEVSKESRKNENQGNA